jgi:hypothetical protein
MRARLSRYRLLFVLCLCLLALSDQLWAQATSPLRVGDPPALNLISVRPSNTPNMVVIEGAAGAVFPGAQVAVRNLYTGETANTQAGLTGAFSVEVRGQGNTPYWISPSESLPQGSLSGLGSLPGGPGAILYGPFPDRLETPPRPITPLVLDGALGDWAALPQALLLQSGDLNFYATANIDSLYLAFTLQAIPTEATQVRVTFTLDGSSYALTFANNSLSTPTVRRTNPNPNDLGAWGAVVAQAPQTAFSDLTAAFELRIPWRALNVANVALESATFNSVAGIGADGVVLAEYPIDVGMILLNEQDGAVRGTSAVGDAPELFTVSGRLNNTIQMSNGQRRQAVWHAQGRVGQLALNAGEALALALDVALDAPAFPAALVTAQMITTIGLQPVAADGAPALGGLYSMNGWSTAQTPSGLAISGLRGDVILGEVVTPPQQVVLRDGLLLFPINVNLPLPDTLPAGLYVPTVYGEIQIDGGPRIAWDQSDIFLLGTNTNSADQSPTATLPTLSRLPLVVGVGGVDEGRSVWALLMEHPSDGTRGLIAEQDQAAAALSNGTRFPSPTYILQPGQYPLEPYVINQMPNDYAITAAPLVPYIIGRVEAQVRRPDGTSDNLGGAALPQNRLSSSALNEKTRFGANTPLDVYRATTLDPSFTDYPFDAYGEYTITMQGTMEDIWGHRYSGGGTYRVLIAEPLKLQTGVLSGTPFEVGNVFNASALLLPSVAADVTVRLRVFPVDGGPVIETSVSGRANDYGYFFPADADLAAWTFTTAGEYTVEYEARYTDANGKLWAASARGAGVIADPNTPPTLVLHGQRGIYGLAQARPLWFFTERYAPNVEIPYLNYPYMRGDVAWVSDTTLADGTPNNGLRSVLRLQDLSGAYETWLLNNYPAVVSPDGLTIAQAAVADELPLLYSADNQAYGYVSAVRAAATSRQLVLGGDANPPVPLWDASDPLNDQIGAGAFGDEPNDVTFIFGGAVVRNPSANVNTTAIYASAAIVTASANEGGGARVFPPYNGEAGGPSGGPLLTLRGRPISMFFHPTAVTPGQTITLGDTFAIAGQVAPTLDSDVQVTVISPSGVVRAFSGRANSIGYYYNPAHNFAVDEAGVWTVNIRVTHSGRTSAGQMEAPLPSGGVLGTDEGTFSVIVVSQRALPWGEERDRAIPAGSPINFTLAIPTGWTDVRVRALVTMPGYLLSESDVPLGARSFSYQYNPAALARDFPNLEIDARPQGPAASDVVTITLVLTATDEGGNAQTRVRIYNVMHDRLLSFEAEPTP